MIRALTNTPDRLRNKPFHLFLEVQKALADRQTDESTPSTSVSSSSVSDPDPGLGPQGLLSTNGPCHYLRLQSGMWKRGKEVLVEATVDSQDAGGHRGDGEMWDVRSTGGCPGYERFPGKPVETPGRSVIRDVVQHMTKMTGTVVFSIWTLQGLEVYMASPLILSQAPTPLSLSSNTGGIIPSDVGPTFRR
ncbi:hypothetical protein EYF80_001585 [Liparis tanakae]|uniref:Uncharacterized protein n=1 Tax=Liparis tanakae TaxID=230148 RepID=A0A4Z2JDT3_9TELE|nr:hypothetical protein EYF80_001585 [Liparis tanakae]